MQTSGDAEGLVAIGQHHRHQHHVGRDREDRAFEEGNDAQEGNGTRVTRQADHPVIKAYAACGLAVFCRLLETGRYGLAGEQRGARGLVLGLEPGHDLGGGRGVEDLADALAGAPDVAPRLGLGVAARGEVHLALVGLGQRVGIEAGRGDAALQVVAVHAGEEVGVDDLLAGRFDDALLVALGRVGFLAGDEARADIGEVGADGLRGQHRGAVGDGAREQQAAVVELAHFGNQREGRQASGVPAGAGADQDQAVDARLQRALGMGDVGDVMEHQAAVALGRLHHVVGRAQRGDLDRHLVFLAEVDVVLQAVVGTVHDLVDGERRHLAVGMLLLVFAQLRGDALQPGLEHFLGPRIQRREGADDARLALLDHQVGIGDDEQRRADHRDREVVAQQSRKGHGFRSLEGLFAGLGGA